MMKNSNFLAAVAVGEAELEDIANWVDWWHRAPGNHSLAEFLGMTDLEYQLWVADPEALGSIYQSYKFTRHLR